MGQRAAADTRCPCVKRKKTLSPVLETKNKEKEKVSVGKSREGRGTGSSLKALGSGVEMEN